MTRGLLNNKAKPLLLLMIFLTCLLIALTSGKYSLTLGELYRLVFQDTTGDPRNNTVFWQIRFPRVLAAILIGGGLAVAGAAYQGMFRNPLVSPDILGVSAGAGVGAVFGIFFGQSLVYIQLFAFAGGLLAVAAVCLIAKMARQHDPILSLVLVGVAISAICGSAISLMKILADPYTQLPSITFWLLGGLSSITQQDLLSVLPIMVIGIIPLLLLRWRMNLLSLSDEEAKSLGVNVSLNRGIFIICATLITASTVSIAGIIGWIGLIVPHITRMIVGANFRHQLPASIAIGAILLLITDTLARTIAAIELPLGILTSAVGAPFFLAILLQTRRVK
ncbi:Probable ABC transporter permease protein HI_1471 [Providencia rustigianii]|uniref:Iron chelate uptake ABC transporter, FeCT family, permease protein n=3 Tax=Providencia rustigianii TaxID=158850 RepID=D1P731_9GAMM|nr:iron chelate uptake ABC transporter, FeCT family, permease protein [Providencia rustigianii DSM 4541]SUC25551.1 Probable ABC transporter permease protein HI_1471 [Providencia rustigianii]SUC34323.1 Probable ABC transporter permease protein HI_1471 [Providencia rustigianii]VEB63437.1 Probable ABC transporter permease protein HI_1471 [Providencia rustigianii]